MRLCWPGQSGCKFRGLRREIQEARSVKTEPLTVPKEVQASRRSAELSSSRKGTAFTYCVIGFWLLSMLRSGDVVAWCTTASQILAACSSSKPL